MPATTQTAPMTAQKVLPVIDDPVMSVVPWPIQTTPVRERSAPTTRLAMVTSIATRWCRGRFGRNPIVRQVHRIEQKGGGDDRKPHRMGEAGVGAELAGRTAPEGTSRRQPDRDAAGQSTPHGSNIGVGQRRLDRFYRRRSAR